MVGIHTGDWIERRLSRGDVPPYAFDLRPCPKCKSVLALMPQDECVLPAHAARGVDTTMWPISSTSDIVAEGPRGGRRAAWAAAVDPTAAVDTNVTLDVHVDRLRRATLDEAPPRPAPEAVDAAWAAAVVTADPPDAPAFDHVAARAPSPPAGGALRRDANPAAASYAAPPAEAAYS